MLGWPVPPVGPGVCRICHGPARHGRAECWCCRRCLWAVGDDPPLVVPVALHRPGDALCAVLRRYKDAPGAPVRRHHRAALAALLDGFMSDHLACIAAAAGDWDAVAVVPSSRRSAFVEVPHPLTRVCDEVGALGGADRLQLVVEGRPPAHLRPRPQAVAATAAVAGRRVLLLDDTWTTGAHALSAAGALRRAGAHVAAIVVLGRIVDPDAAPRVARWWARVGDGSHPSGCCLEALRRPAAP